MLQHAASVDPHTGFTQLSPRRRRRGIQARVRILTLIPLLLAGPACSSLNPYACVYRTRFVGTSGTASVPGGGTVVIQSLNFRENTPEAQVDGSMTWNIRGQDLPAQPVRLTLRDARSPTQVIKPLSLSGASTSAFTAYSEMEIPTAERDQIFSLLNGNAIVVLDLANGSSIFIPATVTEREDWHRPNCG